MTTSAQRPGRQPAGAPDEDAADILAACRRLHAAIDLLDQRAADSLGVSRTDLRCLNLLEHGPLPPARIGAALSLTSGGVTALLDRLEVRGFVARARNPEDRRGVLVELQPIVFETVGATYRSFADGLRATVAGYGAAERAAAAGHLNDAARACEAAATSAK